MIDLRNTCILVRCQCPQRAYFHFYLKSIAQSYGIAKCQCPQRAYFHFYSQANSNQQSQNCVNALNGLTSISTANELECPITAEECQCPQQAYFHFYTVKVAKGISYKVVSMPSTGLLPFLLKKEEEKKIAEIVSMPSTGLLPFLRIWNLRKQ